ncbi:hypothetical protein F4859DRAFT_502736 [Xylaria cf. heliscus]|nr:hypothetical protein F4859DRAFT_502736 [Xylaria cf. heliscus]
MGTPFIAMLEPTKLDGYNPQLPYDQQPPHIPDVFRDAMEVREKVFVQEKGRPLQLEHDADDARSCHWVMYGSLNATLEPEVRHPQTGRLIRPRRSATRSMPIGTLRIVPFPHPRHPPSGARYLGGKLQSTEDLPGKPDSSDAKKQNGAQNSNGKAKESCPGNGKAKESYPGNGNANGTRARGLSPRSRLGLALIEQDRMSAPLPFGRDRATDYHNGREPYIQLSRLAVVPEYRQYGVADQLWAAAEQWLLKNPAYFNPSIKELGMDVLRVDNLRDVPEWDGLLCVHAEADAATQQMYERFGFVIDRGMGRFYNENILRVGMWNRLMIHFPGPMHHMSERRLVGYGVEDHRY